MMKEAWLLCFDEFQVTHISISASENLEVVVSKIFYLYPYLGKWSNLTSIFQMGCNHQIHLLSGRKKKTFSASLKGRGSGKEDLQWFTFVQIREKIRILMKKMPWKHHLNYGWVYRPAKYREINLWVLCVWSIYRSTWHLRLLVVVVVVVVVVVAVVVLVLVLVFVLVFVLVLVAVAVAVAVVFLLFYFATIVLLFYCVVLNISSWTRRSSVTSDIQKVAKTQDPGVGKLIR